MQAYQQCHKKVSWTYSADGCMRDGDMLMLSNKQTQGWLVLDVDDRIKQTDEAYMVTTTKD